MSKTGFNHSSTSSLTCCEEIRRWWRVQRCIATCTNNFTLILSCSQTGFNIQCTSVLFRTTQISTFYKKEFQSRNSREPLIQARSSIFYKDFTTRTSISPRSYCISDMCAVWGVLLLAATGISDRSKLALNQCNVASILLPPLKTTREYKKVSLERPPVKKSTSPDSPFAIEPGCGQL